MCQDIDLDDSPSVERDGDCHLRGSDVSYRFPQFPESPSDGIVGSGQGIQKIIKY